MTKKKIVKKIETKLSKNSKKYKELNTEQGKLKSVLHQGWRDYYKYRIEAKAGNTSKPPEAMADMERQQKKINTVRGKIGKGQINLIQSFRATLGHLN